MKLSKIAAGALVALLLSPGFSSASALGAIEPNAPNQTETRTVEFPKLSISATFPVTGNATLDVLTRAHMNALIEEARVLYAAEDGSSATNIEITFEEFRLNRNVVSFLYTQYAYAQGAAYPILSFSANSFDFKKNEPILLADVVKGDPAETLSPLVRTQLRDVLGAEVYDGLDPDELTEALSDEGAYDAFALSPDGLIIQLQEGLIGPHALGAPRLTIGYDQLGAHHRMRKE